MQNHKRITFFLFFFFSCLALSACARLEVVDNKIGEFLKWEEADDSKEEVPVDIPEGISPEELTKEMKASIDKWLEENDLNRYGDKLDTFYSGGTPLFDEEDGETKERFEYILEKYPDILTKIKKTYDQ